MWCPERQEQCLERREQCPECPECPVVRTEEESPSFITSNNTVPSSSIKINLRGRTPNILQYISVVLQTHTKCMAEHVSKRILRTCGRVDIFILSPPPPRTSLHEQGRPRRAAAASTSIVGALPAPPLPPSRRPPRRPPQRPRGWTCLW